MLIRLCGFSTALPTTTLLDGLPKENNRVHEPAHASHRLTRQTDNFISRRSLELVIDPPQSPPATPLKVLPLPRHSGRLQEGSRHLSAQHKHETPENLEGIRRACRLATTTTMSIDRGPTACPLSLPEDYGSEAGVLSYTVHCY